MKQKFIKKSRVDNRIVVLIPCLNEAKTVAKVIKGFSKELPKAKVYVYDNGSDDETIRVAKRAGAIVKSEPNRGKGNVVRRMFRDIEADCYLMVDGDNTYMANSAKQMCEKVLRSGADMVIGDRLSSNYYSENKNMFRGVGNKVARILVNRRFHSDICDVLTGCRAMSRRFVKEFPAESNGFEVETEMTIFALANGFKIEQVPIKYKDREKGSKSKLKTVSDGVKILRRCIADIKKYRKTRD